MTNAEKYKTVEERTTAFQRFCDKQCETCNNENCEECQFAWLDDKFEISGECEITSRRYDALRFAITILNEDGHQTVANIIDEMIEEVINP